MAFEQKGKRLDEIAKKIKAFKNNQMPTIVGTEAVKFFQYSFRRQGFVDKGGRKKWQSRRDARDSGRAVLVKSGKLRRSIHISKKGNGVVEVATGDEAPYAKVHNEGLKVSGTRNVGAHTRRTHTRTRNGRKETVKEHTVKAHTRIVNFKMPKRQFMGESDFLNKRLTMQIALRIRKYFE